MTLCDFVILLTQFIDLKRGSSDLFLFINKVALWTLALLKFIFLENTCHCFSAVQINQPEEKYTFSFETMRETFLICHCS